MKDQTLESVLGKLEALIGEVESNLTFDSEQPVIFLMGCARSGTTLLSQLLANATDWCYPSNLISRFYYAPYVGAMVQKMLFDLDPKGELLGEYKNNINLSSQLGKTKGALSPHEFWYYWRRFFDFGEIQQLREEELKKINYEGFVNGLKAIQSVFDSPLFLKGMILNWHIPILAELFPNSFFIHIVRDIKFNAQSLLNSRKKFYGDKYEWYSFKPPEYYDLEKLTPEEQVVYQVHYTNLTIKKGMTPLSPERVINLQYESLCENPEETISTIVKRVTSNEPSSGFSISPLQHSNKVTIPLDEWVKIERVAKGIKPH